MDKAFFLFLMQLAFAAMTPIPARSQSGVEPAEPGSYSNESEVFSERVWEIQHNSAIDNVALKKNGGIGIAATFSDVIYYGNSGNVISSKPLISKSLTGDTMDIHDKVELSGNGQRSVVFNVNEDEGDGWRWDYFDGDGNKLWAVSNIGGPPNLSPDGDIIAVMTVEWNGSKYDHGLIFIDKNKAALNNYAAFESSVDNWGSPSRSPVWSGNGDYLLATADSGRYRLELCEEKKSTEDRIFYAALFDSAGDLQWRKDFSGPLQIDSEAISKDGDLSCIAFGAHSFLYDECEDRLPKVASEIKCYDSKGAVMLNRKFPDIDVFGHINISPDNKYVVFNDNKRNIYLIDLKNRTDYLFKKHVDYSPGELSFFSDPLMICRVYNVYLKNNGVRYGYVIYDINGVELFRKIADARIKILTDLEGLSPGEYIEIIGNAASKNILRKGGGKH